MQHVKIKLTQHSDTNNETKEHETEKWLSFKNHRGVISFFPAAQRTITKQFCFKLNFSH